MEEGILLLGGGYVLSKLALRLPRTEFIITSTRQEQVDAFHELGFISFKLDVSNKADLDRLVSACPNIKVVIDSVPPLFHSRKVSNSDLEDSLQGVRNVYETFKSSPLEKFFYLSTTGVYGENRGKTVTERHSTNPLSVRGRARLESERIYRQLPHEVTAFRIAAIYGPDRNPIKSLKEERYPFIDRGRRYSNRIHVDDLVEVLRHAILSKKTLPEIINCSDGKPIKTSKLINYLCKKYDLKKPSNMSIAEAEEKGLYTLLSNQKVSNRLLKKIFKYRFEYSGIKWI